MKIYTIGGYSEVGKNMTAIEVGGEIIIIDMGLYLPPLLNYEEGDPRDLDTKQLMKIGAIPNDQVLDGKRNKVKAITFGHCHLDHIGAAPYLAPHYNCDLIGTRYTLEILKTLLDDKKIKLDNRLRVLNCNSKFKVNDNFTIEFINMTHSTLQVVLIAVHTKEGIVLYANDFKFDNHPVIGKKPDYDRLIELGKTGVKALILDSLNSKEEMKTPSEKVAKELLKDVLLGVNNKGKGVVVTTFASHIARLKTIVELGRSMNRKVVLLGRSMLKYVGAAANINLITFDKDIELVGYRDLIKKKLQKIDKNKGDYLIVCTGNQGEPEAVLSRMAKGEFPFNFTSDDNVIFSCRTIPTAETERNRAILEKRLKSKGVRLFKNIHVSGHASREDHRDLINMTKPKHLFPAHGDISMITGMVDLASEMGYKLGKNVHILGDNRDITV